MKEGGLASANGLPAAAVWGGDWWLQPAVDGASGASAPGRSAKLAAEAPQRFMRPRIGAELASECKNQMAMPLWHASDGESCFNQTLHA